MPAVSEFIADGKTVDEIGEEIGADKLFYQTLDDLIEVTSINGEQSWDTSCFNGEYVTGNVTQEYLDALEAARNDSAKSSNPMSDELLDFTMMSEMVQCKRHGFFVTGSWA